jgi:hypothetical protein
MEKVIHKLINEFTEGVDTYTHNGSTWLIFTESKQWVIELTESKTLWYNYNFFKDVFSYTSMDVVDNQHYITKWVEDNIINKIKDTILEKNITEGEVEEIIENGVKEHSLTYVGKQIGCEDTIKNGVKHTEKSLKIDGSCVIEDTIQNGVKHTEIGWHQCNNIDDAIEYGVKEIFDTEFMPQAIVNDIIQNGVKETKTPGKDGDIMSTIEWMEENKSTSYTKMIDDVIDNGEKINGTYAGGQRQSEKCKSVVEYGTKNPTD